MNDTPIEYQPTLDMKTTKVFLNFTKCLLGWDNLRVVCVTSGQQLIDDHEILFPVTSPLLAMMKCLKNEVPNLQLRCIDLPTNDNDFVDFPNEVDLLKEFFACDEEMYVAYRQHERYILRVNPWNWRLSVPSSLTLPKCERFNLALPVTNLIQDLCFEQSPPTSLNHELKEDEVEIKIQAYGLNFKDVLSILKPSMEFQSLNTVGSDWSGHVHRIGSKVTEYTVGDAVFGTKLKGGAMESHLQLKKNLIMKLSPKMSHLEAVTLPIVSCTAFTCLVQVAALQANERILIHAGSGGVGLIAIQIAMSIGAQIITTAGSERKRAYLRSLGIQYVFNSRNTSFQREIRNALDGGGVDVVLNSLTSEGFKEASLALCNNGARFVEMSKLNIWNHSDVKRLRPDVQYQTVDITYSNENELEEMLNGVSNLISIKQIRPIPYTQFDVRDVREAMGYLQKAKHIGKIVISMDQEKTLFNDKGTYLITGGCSGIGFEVCKWMVKKGAKNIALVGRRDPNSEITMEIQRLNEQGKVAIITIKCDIGNKIDCSILFQKLERDHPPLKGIMHAAGVLDDGSFQNQTWEKYNTTFHSKVDGSWNLHQMSLKYELLEHFVFFSSVASSFGTPGQSNYAAANYFMDSLALYRHSRGLPATTINWGPWGETGMARDVEISGFRSLSTPQGLLALEKILRHHKLQTIVCDADFSYLKKKLPGAQSSLELLGIDVNGESNASSDADQLMTNNKLWKDFDTAGLDSTARRSTINKYLHQLCRHLLALGEEEMLGGNVSFQELGMDSLMIIEMRNTVKQTIEERQRININSIKDSHTLDELTETLVKLLSGPKEEDNDQIDEQGLRQLILRDSQLPSELMLPTLPPCTASDIRSVLLTGATGVMGSYFLRDLSQRPEINRIVLLIRGSGGLDRLKSVLNVKGLLNEINMSKVNVVQGCITKSKLGLQEELYNELSLNMDAVVHLAAGLNLIERYNQEASTRKVNVFGTKEILRFLCCRRVKHLFHASSIAANKKVDRNFRTDEDWPSDTDFDQSPNFAYPISKFICERLMWKGVKELRLPIKVFRFPVVGGDSRSGANIDYKNNQLMLRFMTFLKLGAMPEINFPLFILPVDNCVSFSLQIFFNDATPFDMYNIYNPHVSPETAFAPLAKELGYEIKIMELQTFLKYIETKISPDTSSSIRLLKTFLKKEVLEGFKQIMNAFRENQMDLFKSSKLEKFLFKDYQKEKIGNVSEILQRDFKFAKESGVFEEFGV